MPPRRRPARQPVIQQPPNEDATVRDYVMARVAAAQTLAKDAEAALHDLMGLFLSPDDDRDGEKRAELLQEALESFGGATRALEDAEKSIVDIDPAEGEPWEDE